MSRRPLTEVTADKNSGPATVGAIHYAADIQPSFDTAEAAEFLLEMMPSKEETGIEYEEIDRVALPNNPEPPVSNVVKAITQKGRCLRLGRGNLAEAQQNDKEIGSIVTMRMQSDILPSSESVRTESELTKKLLLKWDELIVKDKLVYRKKTF